MGRGVLKNYFNTLILLSIVPFASKGQVDSSAIFEKTKKQLSHPISDFKKLINYDSIKYNRDGCIRLGNRYYTDTACAVNAIFEGKVISIFELQGRYGVITKFGKYYIVYFGLTKPTIQKSDYVLTNKLLATLIADLDEGYQLELTISTENGELDPSWWIR